MSKKGLLLILLSAIALPGFASALTCTGSLSVNALGYMACSAAKTALTVASYIVILMWVVTGILFLIATGDPAKLKTGKTALIASIAGTVLILVAEFGMSIVSQAFGGI